MKSQYVVCATGLLLSTGATLSSGAQSGPSPDLVAAPGYQVVHGWPVLPEGEVLGSVAGVGVDSHGDVFVFHRAGRTWPDSDVLDLSPISQPTVDVFEGHTGVLIKRWGANLFAMPHGLTI